MVRPGAERAVSRPDGRAVEQSLTSNADSMMGCMSASSLVHALTDSDGDDKGIIPLTTAELFRRIQQQADQDPGLASAVEVSCIEIYNERSDPLTLCTIRHPGGLTDQSP